MIQYKNIRPGDTFVRRNDPGSWEVRRVMSDGTSEFVRRLQPLQELPVGALSSTPAESVKTS